ncbi:MAG: hypothetical protein ABIL09_11075 [Gemmatimonadota bacterium]
MTGLPASAFVGYFQALGEYVEGDSPVYLTPTAGGDPLAFNHDQLTTEVEATEAGDVAVTRMDVTTRTALTLAGTYTYDGSTWTVEEEGRHQLGTSVPVYRYTLACHAE